MNKKGFTLVEILATLVILSFIFMLTYPAIQKAFNNGKTAISELSKKQIEDAAKIVIFLKALKGDKPAIVYPQLPASTNKTPKPSFDWYWL